MCQGWSKPEDWKITLRGCHAFRQQHGRIICHHNWYVGSRRASVLGNKHLFTSNTMKSVKTLSWCIYRDQKSQLRGWAHVGFRRPGLCFWQSHWSINDRRISCFPAPCLNCSSHEMGPVAPVWSKIYGWKTLYKNCYYYYFSPPKHKLWSFFSSIFSNKENMILFTKYRSLWKHFMAAFPQSGPLGSFWGKWFSFSIPCLKILHDSSVMFSHIK